MLQTITNSLYDISNLVWFNQDSKKELAGPFLMFWSRPIQTHLSRDRACLILFFLGRHSALTWQDFLPSSFCGIMFIWTNGQINGQVLICPALPQATPTGAQSGLGFLRHVYIYT